MIRIWFIFFLLFFCYLKGLSQIRFNESYDYNSFANYVSDVIVVKAGGYLMVSPSFNPFQNDTLGYSITTLNFIRTGINGDTLWTKQYRKKGFYLLGENLIETDSGFLFMGSETNLKNGTKSYLIQWKLNFSGDTIATQQMNILPGNDYAMEIIKTRDGGYAVIGQTCNQSNSNCDYYLLKLDSLGNKQWHQTYAQTATSFEYPESIVEESNGNFYLFGTSAILGIGLQYLIKTDSVGKKIWSKNYSPFLQQAGTGVFFIDSDYLILTGGYEDLTDNYIKGYINKIDTSGIVKWTKAYNSVQSCQLSGGLIDINKDLLLIGLMTNFDSINTLCGCLVKVNSSGDSLFQRAYNSGNQFPEWLFSIKPTNDGYIMAGYSVGATQDACLVKVDTFGCLIPGCQTVGLPNIPFNIDPINIFPNPANEYLNLSHSEKIVSYRMADMLGRIVLESRFLEEPIDIKQLKTGAYIIQVMLSNGSQGFGRFVKE